MASLQESKKNMVLASRSSSSIAFCSCEYSCIGLMIVSGAGVNNNLLVLGFVLGAILRVVKQQV